MRRRVSTGIIAEALSTGVIITPRPRCSIPVSPAGAASRGRIERVLCAPIAFRRRRDLPQRSSPPLATNRARVELIARHLAPIAENFILRRRAADPRTTHARIARSSASRSRGRARRSPTTLNQIALVAPLNVTVLLTGESGHRQEPASHALIHDNSPRAAAPVRGAQLRSAARDAASRASSSAPCPAATPRPTARPGKVARRRARHALPRRDRRAHAACRRSCCSSCIEAYYPLGATSPSTADIR